MSIIPRVEVTDLQLMHIYKEILNRNIMLQHMSVTKAPPSKIRGNGVVEESQDLNQDKRLINWDSQTPISTSQLEIQTMLTRLEIDLNMRNS
jgi:hypothetical protein